MAILASGTTVGSYRIEGVLGVGGMGVVYEARQETLDRPVALKALRPELAGAPGFRERFRQEGRLQASFSHPHVVEVLEALETEQGLFLAMRLERGPTLAQLLAAGGLDAAGALRLLGQVASALDAAHAAGLVHRDVKPQNVLVGEAGDAFLADFGLSWAQDVTALTMTGEAALGTLAYVAPELVQGADATAASDRYALAATAFECLTGRPPYPRDNGAAVLFAHVHDPVPRVGDRRPELPAALDAVFAGGLAKDPDRRPADAAGFVARLGEALGAEAARLPAPGATPGRATRARPPAAGPRPRGGRRRVLAGAVGCVLGGAALGAGAFALLEDDDEATGAGAAVPAVRDGAVPLGSALAEAGRTVDCRGRPPSPSSPACSIAQVGLPGRRLVVPEDGAIVGWSIRGARGELALQVLRRRDGGASQVGRSRYEVVNNASPHRFDANIEVQRGDVLALEVTVGSAVGVSAAPGAATDRWFPTRRGKPPLPADRGPGTGLDAEVLVRADYVAGGRQRVPESVSGAAAAALPDGKRVADRSLTFTDGRRVQAVLVELDDRVALDLMRRGRRVARMTVPGFRPGGRVVHMYALNYDDSEASGEVGVEWVDMNSARVQEHYFGVFPRQLEFYD